MFIKLRITEGTLDKHINLLLDLSQKLTQNIIYQNVKYKNVKLLEYNTGQNLGDLGLSNDILDTTSKV